MYLNLISIEQYKKIVFIGFRFVRIDKYQNCRLMYLVSKKGGGWLQNFDMAIANKGEGWSFIGLQTLL